MPLIRSCCGSSEVQWTTGSNAVAGSARMRRQTSYPDMPGIMTSSKTRSGFSDATLTNASSPELALTTA
jgi:hypothetical protein